jgi:hypothetical protein
MADPLSATASIIAVLQLSSTVLRYLVSYFISLTLLKLICKIKSLCIFTYNLLCRGTSYLQLGMPIRER